MQLEPIGVYRLNSSTLFYKHTLPRQPCGEHIGCIELNRHKNYEVALEDLSLFSHIWVLFWCHKAASWKPKVLPPKSSKKRGVFATRSPHRPNPIGMSCLQIASIEARFVYVQGGDLLDGTPILDIKPYLPYSDSIPTASLGWISDEKKTRPESLVFEWSQEALVRSQWLENKSVSVIENFERALSSTGIYPSSSNRIEQVGENTYIKSFRTWRLQFRLTFLEENQIQKVEIETIWSGYNQFELYEDLVDTWNDKALHKEFHNAFGRDL